MRVPTSPVKALAYWTWATTGADPTQRPKDVFDDTPQAGLFKMRKWRNPANPWRPGPWVPAQIKIVPGEIDPETGELMTDETFAAEIDGHPARVMIVWQYGRMIPRAEWEWLAAQSPLLPPTPTGCLGP